MTTQTRFLGNPSGVGTAFRGPTDTDGVPESIAGYTVLRCIGQGGMGSVFEVRHDVLGKHFAMKLLSDSLRENTEAIDRFRSETLALGKLEHPNIVVASDAGVWMGRPYLVTELLQGQDLASRVSEKGKLDRELALSITLQLVEALNAAHSSGYFHRDIKPSNVFLQHDGKTKLLDFGLVRSESNHALTRINCFMGTLDFVAPEQAGNASQAGAASDIYSLGCTLIFLLSGAVPFPDKQYPSMTAKLRGHLQDMPEWLNHAASEHPEWLVDLIRSMIAKNPSDRPASCEAIKTTLESRCFPAKPMDQATSPARNHPMSNSIFKMTGAAIIVASCACFYAFSDNRQTVLDRNSISVTSSPISDAEPQGTDNDVVLRPIDEKASTEKTTSSRSATHAKEKTLPIGSTQNASGISFQGLQFGQSSKNQPSSISTKDTRRK